MYFYVCLVMWQPCPVLEQCVLLGMTVHYVAGDTPGDNKSS